MRILRGMARCSLLLSLLLLSHPSLMADQVILKNGDRITGTIVKKEGNKLTIKTDRFGEVVTPWSEVEFVTADKPLHLVLPDGKTINGVFSLKERKVELTGYESSAGLTPDDVVILRSEDEQLAYDRLTRSGWGRLWEGIGTIGFAGTAGNSRTLTYTAAVTANRTTATDKTTVHFNAIKSTALINGVNEDTAEAIRGGIGYSHNVGSRLFLNGFNDYEYDRFQNLDLRFVIGGGLGLRALKTERSTLELFGGAAYNRSSFDAVGSQKDAEFYWGNEYTLKLNSSTSLTQSYRMFNKINEPGYRVNFDLGLGTRILKWLSWNMSVSDRYLSRPVAGRKTNDFLYTTGIGISFSR